MAGKPACRSRFSGVGKARLPNLFLKRRQAPLGEGKQKADERIANEPRSMRLRGLRGAAKRQPTLLRVQIERLSLSEIA